MVRIAIFPDFGGGFTTSEANDYIGKREDVHWRTALAEYIDSLEVTHSVIDEKVLSDFTQKEEESYIKSDELFFFKKQGVGFGVDCIVDVVDVDTSKKWRICEYDGAEGVQYLNDFELIDKKLNMYR